MNLNLLGHDLSEEFLAVLFDSFEDGLDEGFVLFSLEDVVDIVVLDEGFDTELGFLVGGESFSLLLDNIENSDDGLLIFEDGETVRFLLEDFVVVVEEDPVHISGSAISVIDLAENGGLLLGEAGEEGGELGVSDIDEDDVSGLLFVLEFGLSEDSVGGGDSVGLGNDSGWVQLSNLAGIDEGLLLLLGVVVGHGDDGFLIRDVVDSDDVLEFSEEGSGNLLGEEFSVLILVVDAVDEFSLLIDINSGADPLFLIGEIWVF